MKIAYFLMSATVLSGLTACNSDQNFDLKVSKSLKVNVAPNKSETMMIPAGAYSLNINTGPLTSKMTLSGSSSQLVFRTKSLKNIQDDINSIGDNHVVVRGSEIGQIFDIDVSSDQSLVRTGSEEERSESCVRGSHTEYRQQCYPGQTQCYGGHEVCHQRRDTDGDTRSDYDCHTEGQNCTTTPESCHEEPYTVTDYGSQQVRGRTKYYNTVTNLKFLQGGEAAASIKALSKDTQNFDYSYQGPCY